ncbi:MAG: Peptidase M14 carboxypeptidase A [candidate division CPR2 bacterium GW2011_GWC2_39_10]|uniref:Peptidase M14 carboxypeptidase A n=1 Tax=candidate division CPR2 bacterium GW2011_GWC2_39_10 TaxID=1618345 RepID=A0A0G0LT45_UNCC2|nr:MAG: Peptidase M14 carboxypeptidase A [candidate division CPR2 bacterium GW2011_GWC2_39_10]
MKKKKKQIFSKKLIIGLMVVLLTVVGFFGFRQIAGSLVHVKSEKNQKVENNNKVSSDDNVAVHTYNLPEEEQNIVAPQMVYKITPIPKPMPPQTTFGYSVNGRAIGGWIFGSGTETMFFFGAIHGSEKGTVSAMNSFARYIFDNPTVVGKNKRIIIIPVANPDGYANSSRLNGHAVDINRNFDTAGWTPQGANDNFGGPSSFSEPESRLIGDLVSNYNVSTMVAFHSKGNLVHPEANQSSYDLAHLYSSYSGYRYYNDIASYEGTATNWLREKKGGTAITVELTSHTSSDWTKNRPALLQIIK